MIETFVFSYNRGRYLANLLASVNASGWPGPITIVDDRSDDRSTLRVLARARHRPRTRVVVPPRERTEKYGGFWANMRLAYEELATSRHVMFLQDDLQFVRPITDADITRTVTLIEDPALSPILFPAFWWGARGRQEEYRERSVFVPEYDIYRRSGPSAQPAFSDVSVFDRERLRASGWVSGRSETDADAAARVSFGPMTVHPDPFIAFVPFAPRFRHGRAWSLRADPRRLPFPARFRILDEEQNRDFLARDRRDLPIAADHLTLAGRLRGRLLRDAAWES